LQNPVYYQKGWPRALPLTTAELLEVLDKVIPSAIEINVPMLESESYRLELATKAGERELVTRLIATFKKQGAP